VLGMNLPRLQDLRNTSENMERCGVQRLLRSNETQFIYLGFVAHQVDAKQGVILFQTLADDLDISSLKIVEG